MDIVERLRDITRPPPTREEAADEIERLREALRNIASKNPFHNQCPPINDVQFYSQMIVEMVGIANAALKEKE